MKILVLDPGESTGWLFGDNGNIVAAGTCPKEHVKVQELMESIRDAYGIDQIVYERFQLYPGKAQAQSWSTFYTCEVIGIIKLFADLNEIPIAYLMPGDKEFAGGFGEDWTRFSEGAKVSEHTRDSYRLWKYYRRFKLKIKE